MAVGGAAVWKVARQQVNQLDQPPIEVAKSEWQQLTAATGAGADVWKKGPPTTDLSAQTA